MLSAPPGLSGRDVLGHSPLPVADDGRGPVLQSPRIAPACRSTVIPGQPRLRLRTPRRWGIVPERASRWAARMHRVFAFDVLACPRCGCRRRLVGVYTGGASLRILLERLGLDRVSS